MIYMNFEGVAACFRRHNGTHQFGCSCKYNVTIHKYNVTLYYSFLHYLILCKKFNFQFLLYNNFGFILNIFIIHNKVNLYKICCLL